jgi:hypothetical protein
LITMKQIINGRCHRVGWNLQVFKNLLTHVRGYN